jgi:transposase-like protein
MAKWSEQSVAQWRGRVASQARSGLSVAEYCRREGVNAWLFYRWRKRLGAERRREVGGARASRSSFVDLGAVLSGGSDRARGELRLELGEGIVLTVVRG